MAVLALAAGMSTSFVSCVDTEEPDSIVTLRNAKAEEVKAQAAKINAEVTDLLGRLELDKSTRALADEATKLANARKEAKNAYDKAIEDIQLAEKKAESERKENAAKATADFELQEAKAKAEATLKTALAELEAAKTELTKAQNKAIKDVEAEQLAIDKEKMKVAVETAQFKEWGLEDGKGGYQLKGAKDAYVKALDDLSDALKALKKSIAKLEEDNIETITDKIEDCEKEIANAKEGKAEFDALCKANDIQKWVTKYAELDKKISENDQNPVLSQAKYDKAGLEADLEKLTDQIDALKEKRDGVHADSPEDFDGLVDELHNNMEKTEEAGEAMFGYLEDEVSINLEYTINNELADQLSEKWALEDYIVDATDENGKAIKKFVIDDLKIEEEGSALRNYQIDEDKLKKILTAVEKGESNSDELNQGFEQLTKVSGALYQNIRAVEEGIKTLSTNKAEDELVERVQPTKGKGTLTKWEECATDYLSHTDNQDSYNAFVEANTKLFGTFTGSYEDPEDKTKPIYSDPKYYSQSNYQIPNQPLSVLPAFWDAENKKIDATNLVQYFGVSEADAVYYAKTWFGEYSQYLTIMEKNAKEAEYKEAKEQAEAIIAEIKNAFKNIPVKIAELKKAVEDAYAEEKEANADLVKQIEDIDAQILEKDDLKTLAFAMNEEELTDEDFAAEDGTLIKKQKELNDQIKAKKEEIAKFDVSKEEALRAAILTFGLKLDLFTLDDEGNVQVDKDKAEVAYDEANREDFEKAYQATIDYYDNGIKDGEEQLKYYQEILKAFQDKISGANTAADDKDVNKAIDFDFSSKALKEFFESDGIEKDYADLIKDVEAKQADVKTKETELEKAEADYNFYKKAYGVDKE